ncbi:MAG: TIR domain-containing protein [Gammaproteobacteria bacterium]|nr:TIR domain-containing protein [Gammaproteobacteria bacterium]
MPNTLRIFISYSHQDAQYLGEDSLLGFLKGLQKGNVEFWTDRKIRVGESWDEVIKASLQKADIALVLVSQAFLDSDYCQHVEIRQCLAQQTHLFPIILSPCDWRRHDWLSSRQFLPGGDQTVEEHFMEMGQRKRLFLKIREQLQERIDSIQQARQSAPNPQQPTTTMTPGKTTGSGETILLTNLPGPVRITLCRRLGEDWVDLAVYLGIPKDRQCGFTAGRECHDILAWLEERAALHRLPEGLFGIGRPDLVKLLNNAG